MRSRTHSCRRGLSTEECALMISYEGMSPFSIGIRNTPQEGKPATIRLNVPVSNWKERLLPSPEEGKWAVHSIIDMNSGRENELGVVVYDMHITLTFIPEDLILRQGGKDQK